MELVETRTKAETAAVEAETSGRLVEQLRAEEENHYRELAAAEERAEGSMLLLLFFFLSWSTDSICIILTLR